MLSHRFLHCLAAVFILSLPARLYSAVGSPQQGAQDADQSDRNRGDSIPSKSSSKVPIKTSAGSVKFSLSAYSVPEIVDATIRVWRTGGAQGAVSVDYATISSTATAGQDFVSVTGTLNWADGESGEKTFPVSIVDDDLIEEDEALYLVLSNPTGGVAIDAPTSVPMIIADYDHPRLRFSPNPLEFQEDVGTATIVLERFVSGVGEIIVDWEIRGWDPWPGNAEEGTDFIPSSGTIRFANGEMTPKQISVRIVNDSEMEPEESFYIALTNPRGDPALVPEWATITILENDRPTTFDFTVNSTLDVPDVNPGDGVAETAAGNGVCTLRAAIMECNALPGPQRVSLPPGTYTITIDDSNTTPPDEARGNLNIQGDFELVGAGAASTIVDGGGISDVFELTNDIFYEEIRISNLTVQNGSGGGILNFGVAIVEGCTISNNEGGNGGGIFNTGILAVRHCTIADNVASGTMLDDLSEPYDGSGGGIITWSPSATEGDLTVVDSTIARNRAQAGGGIFVAVGMGASITRCSFIDNIGTQAGGALCQGTDTGVSLSQSAFFGNSAPDGGAVYSHVGSPVTIRNCTISSNTATDQGGGVYFCSNPSMYVDPSLFVTQSTIANNRAAEGGGIYHRHGGGSGGAGIKNSIVAGNSGGDVAGEPVRSNGHNIVGDNSCTMTHAVDFANTDPKLAPLADNGGPTLTHALLPGSPALEAADHFSPLNPWNRCSDKDQRGVLRPQGIGCDIGAFELESGGSSSVRAWTLYR